MSEDYAIQISFKTPTQTLINLRGADEDELGLQLDALGRLLPAVGSVEATLAAMQNIYNGLSPIEKIKDDAEKAAKAPAQQARPAVGGASTAGPNGSLEMCVHGDMIRRESKPGAAKQWKGWFCPTPQGTPDQCAPKFDKR